MNFRHRVILLAGLALFASTSLSAPSSAQKGETAALSAKINELSRAGKYSEALPLAQGQLQTLEKKYGSVHRDVAGALNNLAELYGHQATMPRPSRCSSARSQSSTRWLASTRRKQHPS